MASKKGVMLRPLVWERCLHPLASTIHQYFALCIMGAQDPALASAPSCYQTYVSMNGVGSNCARTATMATVALVSTCRIINTRESGGSNRPTGDSLFPPWARRCLFSSGGWFVLLWMHALPWLLNAIALGHDLQRGNPSSIFHLLDSPPLTQVGLARKCHQSQSFTIDEHLVTA
jgi:hypothetical protein